MERQSKRSAALRTWNDPRVSADVLFWSHWVRLTAISSYQVRPRRDPAGCFCGRASAHSLSGSSVRCDSGSVFVINVFILSDSGNRYNEQRKPKLLIIKG